MRDLLADVTIELDARRARTILMAIAVGLSVGALLCALGFSMTAARQVDADLAATAVDLITVTGSGSASRNPVFPDDVDTSLGALDLVISAGRRIDVTSLVGGASRADERSPVTTELEIVGISSGYLRASCPDEAEPSAWLLDDSTPVVFLGSAAAEALQVPVTSNPTGYQVEIDHVDYAVAGFACTSTGALADTVALPFHIALAVAGSDGDAEVLVRTTVGAGANVARVVRQAIRPEAPETLRASQVVDPANLRTGVSTQLGRLAAWIGGLLLALTILLIANAMIVSVLARTTEIGVRRAIGTSKGDVALLFLIEGAVIGVLGGAMGSAVAAMAVVAVSAVNQWTPALGGAWIVAGPVLGAVVGLASSAYPAWRATGIQPALAVRSD